MYRRGRAPLREEFDLVRLSVIEEIKQLRSNWRVMDWRWQMKHRLISLEELALVSPHIKLSKDLQLIEKQYPFAITPYYLSLIKDHNFSDPIFAMSIPQIEETHQTDILWNDPLGEQEHSPVEGLLHRYPDRVVLLLTGLCPTFCRYCTRKRLVGLEKGTVTDIHLESWVRYIREHSEIKDVILSGGDPLTLNNARLEKILRAIRDIESVEIIRIGTKIPSVMPMRITDELCEMLDQFQPLWVITHFNHPHELTKESKEACERLVRSGIPVNNQSVLLRGINDHPDIIEDLCRGLVKMRVRPYYLHQTDLVQGIEHLRTPISKGIEIMEALRGRLGGLAIPQYVVDLPLGGGKVPILPQYIISQSPDYTVMRNFEGRIVSYPEPKSFDHPKNIRKNERKTRLRGGISDQLSGLDLRPLIPTKTK